MTYSSFSDMLEMLFDSFWRLHTLLCIFKFRQNVSEIIIVGLYHNLKVEFA
jgi:hypothetical protein